MGKSTDHKSSIPAKLVGGASGLFFPIIKFFSCFTDIYKHGSTGDIKAVAGDLGKITLMLVTSPIGLIGGAGYGLGQGIKKAERNNSMAFVNEVIRENFSTKVKEVNSEGSGRFHASDLEKRISLRNSKDDASTETTEPASKTEANLKIKNNPTILLFKQTKATGTTQSAKAEGTSPKFFNDCPNKLEEFKARLAQQEEMRIKRITEISSKNIPNEKPTAQTNSNNSFIISAFQGCLSFYRNAKIVFTSASNQPAAVDEAKSTYHIAQPK